MNLSRPAVRHPTRADVGGADPMLRSIQSCAFRESVEASVGRSNRFQRSGDYRRGTSETALDRLQDFAGLQRFLHALRTFLCIHGSRKRRNDSSLGRDKREAWRAASGLYRLVLGRKRAGPFSPSVLRLPSGSSARPRTSSFGNRAFSAGWCSGSPALSFLTARRSAVYLHRPRPRIGRPAI